MEKEASIKEEHIDIADKVNDVKAKLAFLNVVITRTLLESGFSDEVLSGFQSIMQLLEDELKEVRGAFDKILPSQEESQVKAAIIIDNR